jgi:hypothetical protein
MNSKTAGRLVFVLGILHFGINLILEDPIKINEILLASFYTICLILGYGINVLSTWLKKNSKIQLGQAFMIFSFLKLVILAVALILLIRTYELHKLSTIVHFMFPYYFATGLAVLRLLKHLNIGSDTKHQ